MNTLIHAKDIYVEYAGENVLDIDQLELYSYERIGLVGANGAGKSTLLKVLLGQVVPTHGMIIKEGNFSYIPQLDSAVIQEQVDHALMGKLGVNKIETEHSSGGEETRIKIAQALSGEVHGIFADEPTSHLDREGANFLIKQLSFYSGALLIISHDRHVLDRLVDKIWELKDGKITEYWGNYSDYLEQKEEERSNQQTQFKQFIAERERLEKSIADKKSQAQKIDQKQKKSAKKKNTESGGRLAHQKSTGNKQKKLYTAAKNMEHRIELLGDVKSPDTIRPIHFHQSQSLALHNPFPIIGHEINKQLGNNIIFHKASFQFPLGAKIAIIGTNGSGKTTLFQMIMNEETGITLAPKAKIGYFMQNGYKFNGNQVIMNYIQENSEYTLSEIRSVLASLGFSPQDLRKSLSVLSGGEIMKLQLAKMLLGQYNILLMDEPSNFLDLPSVEALENLMISYAGTIVFVSHDVRLIDHVADQIYAIEDKQLVRKQ